MSHARPNTNTFTDQPSPVCYLDLLETADGLETAARMLGAMPWSRIEEVPSYMDMHDRLETAARALESIANDLGHYFDRCPKCRK